MRHTGLPALVAATLRETLPAFESLGPARWMFTLTNGKPFKVGARLDGDWLLLVSRPHRARAPADPWSLLAANRELRGASKIATSADRAPELCAELPSLDATGLKHRLAETFRGLEQAAARIGSACRSDSEGGPAQELEPAEGEADSAGLHRQGEWVSELQSIAEEAGWDCRRTGRALDFDLEVPGGTYRATATPAARGRGWRLSTAIIEATHESATVREAIARLLLAASGELRMARAVAAAGEKVESGFEAWLGHSPSAGELHHALSALSVACRRYGREARALQHDDLAEHYLAVRNPPETARRDPRTAPRTKPRTGGGR